MIDWYVCASDRRSVWHFTFFSLKSLYAATMSCLTSATGITTIVMWGAPKVLLFSCNLLCIVFWPSVADIWHHVVNTTFRRKATYSYCNELLGYCRFHINCVGLFIPTRNWHKNMVPVISAVISDQCVIGFTCVKWLMTYERWTQCDDKESYTKNVTSFPDLRLWHLRHKC